MREVAINLGARSYSIYIEKGILPRVGEYCKTALPKAKTLAVVTDETVAPLYSETVMTSLRGAGFSAELITLPAGESTKSLEMLGKLYDFFASIGITRTDGVVALGGGVIGDLTGFGASTFLRGVDFVQIPTTLLSQVDSSVGGKVAIDLPSGKNLAGAFWQPRLVVIDPNTLDTLTDSTFADGMAEVLKYGCIQDATLFDTLCKAGGRTGVTAIIDEVVETCCTLKKQVVEEDENDTGIRMILNFGHTLGHAYERAGNYEIWTHGQAVSAGMVLACQLGATFGVTPSEVFPRLETVLKAYHLPTNIPCTMEDYTSAIGLDKKGAGSQITLILLKQLGEATLYPMEKAVLFKELETLLTIETPRRN